MVKIGKRNISSVWDRDVYVCAPVNIFRFLGGWLVEKGRMYAVPIAGYLKSDFRILRLP